MDTGPFGPPRRWRHDDLIAWSERFDASLTISAYRCGVFPMPTHGVTGWYSPLRRAILPLNGLRISRSLRKSARRYPITVDKAFGEVLAGCADPTREGGWIDPSIQNVYGQLFDQRMVHSVEAWTSGGELAGGLYGVSLGGLFAGESMFHRPDIGRDASKAALIALVELLCADGVQRLLDVQWLTPHLASLGAIEISRQEYLARLSAALPLPAPSWPTRSD